MRFLLWSTTLAVVAGASLLYASAALAAADACLATGCKPGVLFDQWLDGLRQALVEAAAEPEAAAVPRLARAIDVGELRFILTDPDHAKHNTVLRRGPGGEMLLSREPILPMRDELTQIIEENK